LLRPDAFAVHAQTTTSVPKPRRSANSEPVSSFELRGTSVWTNDLSFGMIDGTKNNFGMFRSGLNLAF